jgi:ABC-type nitrate/sulfonate/bicarbonate transport system permease component
LTRGAFWLRVTVSLISVAAVLMLWEYSVCTPVLAANGGYSTCDGRLFVLFSKPSEIARQIVQGEISLALLFRYSAVTAVNASAGLALAGCFAFVWYWLGVRLKFVRNAGYAFVWFFQVVPYVAFAWIFSIIFGAGDKLVFGFLVAVFPLIGALLTALRSVPPPALEVMTLYKASHTTRMQHLYLPLAAPYFFGGLAIAAPLSVVGVLIADLSGGSSVGLGKQIFTAVRNAEPAELWVYTFAAVIISLALCAVVWLGEALFSGLNRWYSTEGVDVAK